MQMRATRGQDQRFATHLAGAATFALTATAVALVAALMVPGLYESVARLASLVGHLDADAVQRLLYPLGVWAPVVFVIVQAAQVLVPFLPGAPITIAGVLLFGWQAGLALSMAGFMLGTAAQFAAVRRWGRPLVVRLAGEELVARYAGRLDPNGWWLLAAFLVPFAPADAFSALAALSQISFRRFMVVSFLGRLPWAVAAVLLAAGLLASPLLVWAVAGSAVVVIVALSIARSRRASGAADGTARSVTDGSCSSLLCRLRCPHRSVT